MPDKLLRMHRASLRERRPVMVAIAGDSAAGKTTLTAGIVAALGAERITSICADDYHRYDRTERKELPFTALHPDCNYISIMEQQLQLLATGQPILKPVYDHSTGELVRPELVEPREFVIVEGLLPLTTRMSRACFDVSVYLDPPEPLRHEWKIARDTGERGYERDQVEAELARREPESAEFIRPQRAHADIVVRFAPIDVREDPPGTPLSAELILRPTVGHPDLTDILSNTDRYTMHLKLLRDDDGRPVDALHVHGYVDPAETEVLAKSLWTAMGGSSEVPDGLGRLGADGHSEPLAITQLLLLHHLVAAGR
ncbi:MAG: phosphoribulokinase [Geodermatophilaceae bacterium]|nr:phosphoribulokinase [Geodermatophilaceae bacterium]MDQ3455356.1 phosphoribulokinase [Actinomycetota bacterium]